MKFKTLQTLPEFRTLDSPKPISKSRQLVTRGNAAWRGCCQQAGGEAEAAAGVQPPLQGHPQPRQSPGKLAVPPVGDVATHLWPSCLVVRAEGGGS